MMSSLSVEAQCFVPCSSNTAVTQGSQPTQGSVKKGGRGSKKLPKYITSCYPFVQGDPGPPPR